jgi:hypothetical protein
LVKGGRGPRYDIADIEATISLILFLDGYRVHHYVEIDWVDRLVREGRAGRRFKAEWEHIRKVLVKMAQLPRRLSYLVGLAKLQNLLRLISYVVSSLTFALMGLGFFFYWGRNPAGTKLLVDILTYLGVPLLLVLLAGFAGPPLIARRIYRELEAYRAENPERYRQFDRQLKAIIQALIDSVRAYIREHPEPPQPTTAERIRTDPLVEVDKTFKGFFGRLRRRPPQTPWPPHLELFKTDYQGIRIVKPPGIIRKYYTVAIDT